MSILDFKAALLGGGARANQFRVELAFPTIVSGAAAAARNAQFLCTATALPGSTIGVAPVFYRGREVKLPGERQFQNWTITILNDTDFAIRNSFEKWMNMINDVKQNTGITNPLAISTQMGVHQLDRNGVTLKSYKFTDVWPVNLSEIALAFGQNDQVEEFSIELAYSYWETSQTSSIIGGSIGINTPFGGAGVSF